MNRFFLFSLLFVGAVSSTGCHAASFSLRITEPHHHRAPVYVAPPCEPVCPPPPPPRRHVIVTPPCEPVCPPPPPRRVVVVTPPPCEPVFVTPLPAPCPPPRVVHRAPRVVFVTAHVRNHRGVVVSIRTRVTARWYDDRRCYGYIDADGCFISCD